jgi:hypothetical protein
MAHLNCDIAVRQRAQTGWRAAKSQRRSIFNFNGDRFAMVNNQRDIRRLVRSRLWGLSSVSAAYCSLSPEETRQVPSHSRLASTTARAGVRAKG